MQNIEIKYKISQPGLLLQRLAGHGEIEFKFRHNQKDIYFKVAEGRLKIRIEENTQPCLIQYYRPDTAKPRISNYTLTKLDNHQTKIDELDGEFGMLTVVEKTRELHLFKNVRIHLDKVNGLGWFAEFESVISDNCDKSTARKNLQEILGLLQRHLDKTVAKGYLELQLGQLGEKS